MSFTHALKTEKGRWTIQYEKIATYFVLSVFLEGVELWQKKFDEGNSLDEKAMLQEALHFIKAQHQTA
jgi:hypothetical protein